MSSLHGFAALALIHGRAVHPWGLLSSQGWLLSWERVHFYGIPLLAERGFSFRLPAVRHVVMAEKCPPWCVGAVFSGALLLTDVPACVLLSHCLLIYLLLGYKLLLDWVLSQLKMDSLNLFSLKGQLCVPFIFSV